MRLRRVSAAALLGLTAAAAAGCSGGGGGGTAPHQASAPAAGATAPATGATVPATGRATGTTAPGTRATGSAARSKTMCADSSSAAVSQALGLAVGPVVATDEGPVTVCAYTGRYEVLVRYQTGENASQFAQDRQSAVRLRQSVTTIAGLGEEAFLAASPPSYTLAARNNDNMAIFITAPASFRSMRMLMTSLLEKT